MPAAARPMPPKSKFKNIIKQLNYPYHLIETRELFLSFIKNNSYQLIRKPAINIAEIKGAHGKNNEIKQCSGIELNEKLVLNELKTIDQ